MILINYYVCSSLSGRRGIHGIANILERTYEKLEHKYYKEILSPDLDNYFKNTKNSD